LTKNKQYIKSNGKYLNELREYISSVPC